MLGAQGVTIMDMAEFKAGLSDALKARKRNDRRYPRTKLVVPAILTVGEKNHPVHILNISQSGALLRSADKPARFASGRLSIPGFDREVFPSGTREQLLSVRFAVRLEDESFRDTTLPMLKALSASQG